MHDAKVHFDASAQLAAFHARDRSEDLVEAHEVKVVGQQDEDEEDGDELPRQVHNQESEQLKNKRTGQINKARTYHYNVAGQH